MAARSAGWQLRLWLGLRYLLQPLAPWLLKRRLAMGKEDPARLQEKLGIATRPRPEGRVVWLHAVGLGEVLALRPLIAELSHQAPDLHFLITSTARSSAAVLAPNLPPRCQHQFLPLDGPRYTKRFLDHWRPSLSIWAEQDLWPGLIHDASGRGIPLALINARLTDEGARKRARLRGLYRDTYACFSLIMAQDEDSARHLAALGARDPVAGRSLKPAAQPLNVEMPELARLQRLMAGRRAWVAASTHPMDEAAVIAAHELLLVQDPQHLLILVPRDPGRRDDTAILLAARGLSFACRSRGQDPGASAQVLLADTFGELGLWYRLGGAAFIGGSLDRIGGHNPWEAICLGLPVIHGPHVWNFRRDYADLTRAGLATEIPDGKDAVARLARAVVDSEGAEIRTRAEDLVNDARALLGPLARTLLSLAGSAP